MNYEQAHEFERGDRVQVKERRKTPYCPAIPRATGTVGLISVKPNYDTWEVGVIFDKPVKIAPWEPNTFESGGGYGISTRQHLAKL